MNWYNITSKSIKNFIIQVSINKNSYLLKTHVRFMKSCKAIKLTKADRHASERHTTCAPDLSMLSMFITSILTNLSEQKASDVLLRTTC